MSERIHIVLPNGIKEKLHIEAKKQSRKVGNLAMKYVIDGLSRESQFKITDRIDLSK